MNIIEPSEGMYLCNGATASKRVILGINDTAENWYEITEEEAQAILNPIIDEDIDDTEALEIILGETP